ncbi:MAG: hypothetical protein VB996_14195, partial [Pseudomonadales bacterium]
KPRCSSLVAQASLLKPRCSSLVAQASLLKPRCSSLVAQAPLLKPGFSSPVSCDVVQVSVVGVINGIAGIRTSN